MVKQIKIDENNVVICCSVGGFVEGGFDVEDIPDEVMACPSRWLFIPADVETDVQSIQASKAHKIFFIFIGSFQNFNFIDKLNSTNNILSSLLNNCQCIFGFFSTFIGLYNNYKRFTF